MVSCGFDAAKNDPLGGMSLTPFIFGYMAMALKNLKIPIVYSL